MTPYPNRDRAARAVRRRREAYQRTVIARYTHFVQRYALGFFDEEPSIDPAVSQWLPADETLRRCRQHEERLAAFNRMQRGVFRRVYLNAQLTELDT